jgi:hypothetical protein
MPKCCGRSGFEGALPRQALPDLAREGSGKCNSVQLRVSPFWEFAFLSGVSLMNSNEFELPETLRGLVAARNALKDRYISSGLTFTLDGNLVGDLGEAIAAELFGLRLDTRSVEGTDGTAPNGWSVQVKASGTGRGPAFRNTRLAARHLLFFGLDFENLKGQVIYNGPEEPIRAILLQKATWTGQRQLSVSLIKKLDLGVASHERLARVD